MRPVRLSPFLRSLLALLTVVAAFAFQARVGGMVDMELPGGVTAMPVAGPEMIPVPRGSSARLRPLHPAPDPISRQQQHGQTQHGQTQHSQEQNNDESHNHAAHCPFCVTGAFALEASVLPLLTAPPHLATQPHARALTDVPAAPRHADARAPPVPL